MSVAGAARKCVLSVRSASRYAGRAVSVLLVLTATACQMPHMQRPVAETERPPEKEHPTETTGEETVPPELPNTPDAPESPAPTGALPALTIADVSVGEAAGALTFTVSLSLVSGAQVTVRYDATEDGTATAGADYDAESGTLTFPADSTVAQTIRVTVTDDAVDEEDETFTMRLHDPRGATLADGEATAKINDDDTREVRVQPDSLNVDEGASARYTVVLGSRPTASVMVTMKAPAKLSTDPPDLMFKPDEWAIEQTVTVTAALDDDAIVDKPVAVLHTVRGGDYEDEGGDVVAGEDRGDRHADAGDREHRRGGGRRGTEVRGELEPGERCRGDGGLRDRSGRRHGDCGGGLSGGERHADVPEAYDDSADDRGHGDE